MTMTAISRRVIRVVGIVGVCDIRRVAASKHAPALRLVIRLLGRSCLRVGVSAEERHIGGRVDWTSFAIEVDGSGMLRTERL